jgi:hypothetical protein
MTVCEQGDTEQVQQFTVAIAGVFSAAATTNLQNNEVAMRFTSYAGETFYTKAFDITGGASGAMNGVVAAADEDVLDDNLEAALEAIPNKRVGKVTMNIDATHASQGATAMEFSPIVTFHHEDQGNNYGAQNLLKCPHERTFPTAGATTGSTFGCGAAGCQPRIQQPRAVMVMSTDNAGASPAEASATVSFTAGSVVTCPVGVTCTVADADEFTGSVSVFVEGSAPYNVHAVGAAGADYTTAAAGSAQDVSDAANLEASTYKFLGPIAEIATSVSSFEYTIDLSSIMADTWVTIACADASCSGAADTQFMLSYTPASCTDASDVTIGGAAPFENYDIENIECSGRGECDRTSGQCQCFHGYTGLNCGEQTILV